MAAARSGDDPLSVRARPSSPKRNCARRTTSTGGKLPVNVHAKSRLALECLCGHSGQKPRARREPARTGRGPSPAKARGGFQGQKVGLEHGPHTARPTIAALFQGIGWRPHRVDNCGVSAQPATSDRPCWTTCSLRRIWRFLVLLRHFATV